MRGNRCLIALIAIIITASFTAEAQGYSRPQQQRYRQQNNYNNYQREQNNYNYDNAGYSSIFHYKGFVETGYSIGVGKNRANQFEALTTHGLTLGDMLFLGIGSGVNIYFPERQTAFEHNKPGLNGSDDTALMIPIFFDGRISGNGKISPYFDAKVGISILATSNMYVNEDFFDDGNVCYYLSTSFGARFAIGNRSAFSVGLVYNLVGQGNYDYDYYGQPYYVNGPSLSNIGLRATLEW